MENKKIAAEVIMDIVYKQGVEYIFGLPGGAAIPLFDALVDSPIKLILTRHEQGATHMADGYSRSTGKVGVVLVTSGPGATNTISGILTAHMDSIPMIILCGQQTRNNLGLDAFQEADVSGISYPVVKHSYLVKDPESVPRILNEAFYIARTGRPGPVLIDLPKDVINSKISADYNAGMDLPGYLLVDDKDIDLEEVDKAVKLIESSEKPLLLVGHGAIISGANKVIKDFAEVNKIPVTNTLLGKGGFPENHDLSLGMLGMHGTAYANKAIIDCDLLMSIGSRWDDRITGKLEKFCPDAKKIHIDIDNSEIDKVIKADCAIVADANAVMHLLINKVNKKPRDEWINKVNKYKKDFPLSYPKSDELKAQYIIEEAYNLSGGNAIFVTDVGQHQMWAAQYCKTINRYDWLSSGGAGTMGFGFPAAIGAQFANKNRLVVAIVGDGSFQMTMSELATAQIHKLPLKILIINNNYLGMVRQWQNLFYKNRLSGVDLEGNPDFARLAECYGIKAFTVTKSKDVKQILKESYEYNEGPCLINAIVEKEDNVFPMIPSGGTYEDMILEAPNEE